METAGHTQHRASAGCLKSYCAPGQLLQFRTHQNPGFVLLDPVLGSHICSQCRLRIAPGNNSTAQAPNSLAVTGSFVCSP